MRTTFSKPFFLLAILLLLAGSGQAAVHIRPGAGKTLWHKEGPALEKAKKLERKLEKNSRKFERRARRLEGRLEKKGIKADIWDESKFRLGLLLLAVALGLGIISLLISFWGLFSFMAGLFALAGIILAIWGAVEHYG